MDPYYSLIQYHSTHSHGDSTRLFEAILSLSQATGLDKPLAYLEHCVTEKRMAWLDANLARLSRTRNLLLDGYRIFYEVYLGVSTPADGEIVVQDDRRMVMRWWNPCPTLAACQKLGLDTRRVCRLAYHRPVQAFLSRIDPRLRFERNYEALRPYAPYCEEVIRLAAG